MSVKQKNEASETSEGGVRNRWLTRILNPRLSDCIVIWVLLGLCFGVPLLDRLPAHDTWWHLQTGRIIATTHSIPTNDIYSYTAYGKPWVVHEWLSLLLTWLVFSISGFTGIAVLKSLLIMLTFIAVFETAKSRTTSGIAAISATAVAALISLPGWSPRPQLFGYLCFAILIWLIERFRRGVSLWPIVPLFALWANLHASWPVGIGVLVLTGVEVAWLARAEKRWLSLRAFLGLFLLVLAALFLNPRPIAILSHPLHYFGPMRDQNFVAWQTFVSEWHSPDFHAPSFMLFAVVLVALPALMAVSRMRIRTAELALVLGLAGAALYCQRHIPIFAIALAPTMAKGLDGVIQRCGRDTRSGVERREPTALNWIFILALPALILIVFRCSPNPLRHLEDYPVRSFDYLEHDRRSGKLLTEYNWGGYAIFRLWPRYRVFVDGRADVYSGEIAAGLTALCRLEPGWQDELKKADPDVVIWRKSEPLAQAMELLPQWRRVRLSPDDRYAAVFVRSQQPTDN